MYGLELSNAELKEALEGGLVFLLTDYAEHHRALSPWDCHCLSQAIGLLSVGLYGQALERVTQILHPPTPLPAYPIPKPLTLEDVRRALQLISKDALTEKKDVPRSN